MIRKEDQEFEALATRCAETATQLRAPAKLKSRIYSELIRRQERQNPLRVLQETEDEGWGLCVFEDLYRAATSPQRQSLQCCQLCHARMLAERLDNAPIYWRNCPYVEFQNR